MSNHKINKYIHVEIMGNCWHTPMIVVQDNQGRYWRCAKADCRAELGHQWDEPLPPDYCSDAEPRSLLNDVLAKLNSDLAVSCSVAAVPTFRATAEQIARACVEAHQQDKQAA